MKMVRIRTIFGLQEKNESTLDGYNTDRWKNVRCWMDDEGNLYGATCLKGHDKSDTTSVYNNDGSITVSRVNRDYTDVKGRIEQLTGKKVRPVDVSGLFPYLNVKGHGMWHGDSDERVIAKLGKNHWYRDAVLRGLGERYSFSVCPLVIPKKYANKMEVKEMNIGMMEETVKAELREWSVI